MGVAAVGKYSWGKEPAGVGRIISCGSIVPSSGYQPAEAGFGAGARDPRLAFSPEDACRGMVGMVAGCQCPRSRLGVMFQMNKTFGY